MRQACTAIALVLVALVGAGQAGAASIRLQPDEAASKDVFVYSFAVPGTLGVPTAPNVSNFDDETMDAIDPDPALPFGESLGAALAEPFTIPPSPQLREHAARTLIEFDLGNLGIAADRVAGATLNLFATQVFPAFENPTANAPVTTELRRMLGDWNEQEVTWETQPAAGEVTATVVQNGIDEFLSFEITELVKLWLTDEASNFGMQLSQQGVVPVPQGPGERDRFRGSVYASSATIDPSRRPFLEITLVPLPPTLLLLVSGAALLFGIGRARQA